MCYILYVYNSALACKSRIDAEVGTNLTMIHFTKFGLEIHMGKIYKASKIECVFFLSLGDFKLAPAS